jgi:hypothetical protein
MWPTIARTSIDATKKVENGLKESAGGLRFESYV